MLPDADQPPASPCDRSLLDELADFATALEYAEAFLAADRVRRAIAELEPLLPSSCRDR